MEKVDCLIVMNIVWEKESYKTKAIGEYYFLTYARDSDLQTYNCIIVAR